MPLFSKPGADHAERSAEIESYKIPLYRISSNFVAWLFEVVFTVSEEKLDSAVWTQLVRRQHELEPMRLESTTRK